MFLSIFQDDFQRGAVEANIERVAAALSGAGEADLIVLPELFASGYYFEDPAEAHALAEPVPDGLTCRALEAWARQTGATIVAGLPERSADGRCYNSAVAVTPRGWLGTYRKTHLFYEETLHFAPGDTGFPVFTVTDRRGRSYRLGMMICFDWYYPEAARTLALGGADVIAHPSNLVLPHCPDSMPVRARENRVFTATANRIGTEANTRGTLSFIGRSRICGPHGDVLAEAGRDAAGWISAEIDPREARDKRLNPYNDLLAGRRPALYRLRGEAP
ncbi:MAG: nitrilase-related carbon-nitrogen hydrolase [Rubricoccaceae bacterium]